MIDFIETDELKEQYRNWLRNYINNNCIVRVPTGSQPMLGKKPGTYYVWQFYLRRGLFNSDFSYLSSLLLLDKIQSEIGHFNFQLAGLETASTPLLVSIPIVAKTFGIDINAFSVRKNRKEYGLHNWIEGPIIRDLPVLLVDDLCNSSNSMQKAMHTIYDDQKLEFLKFALTVVNKSENVFKNCKTMPADMKMLSLFCMNDFELTYEEYHRKKCLGK